MSAPRAETERSAAGSATPLVHLPALDGLRGLAVAAVLVLHAGPASWLPGGFLGVSLFFTLSGYLIGSLVLAEVEASGSLSLAAFWARRMRRLLPALVLTVLGVVVMSWFVDLPSSTRGELLGGLGYVANWVQVAGGQSYAELFESPSAVTHLWSLAIEEQFYVVFPFLAWLVARRVPGGLRRAYVIGGLAVVGIGVAVASTVDDRVFSYYATPVRAPEIAVGTVLAGLWPMGHLTARWRDAADPGASGRMVRVNVLGAIALAVTMLTWRTTDLSTEWVYSGGLAVVALVSGALLIAATAPGPVATVLATWPLQVLGKLSYGLYLFHWPVVVLLSPPRVDLDPVPLFGLRVGVSLVLTVASYLLVEQPIRRGRLAPSAAPGVVVGAGLLALVATGVVAAVGVRQGGSDAPPPPRPAPAVVTPGAGTGPVEPDDARTPTDPTATTEPGPPVVALLGDSLPNWLVRDGGWALDPEEVVLIDGTSEGCDGAEGAPVGRAGTGVVVTVPESCTGWQAQYPPVVEGAGVDVDVAVLVVGTGAVLDRELDGAFAGPCTAGASDWYRDDVVRRLRYLAGHAERVVLVLPAWSEAWSGWVNPPDHHQRTDCVRTTLAQAAAEADATPPVTVVDLGAHLCPDGREVCRPVRESDGVHVDPEAAGPVLEWMVGSVLDARPPD